MVLGNKLPVPGRLTNLDYSRARAVSTVVGLFGHFSLVCHFTLLSPSQLEKA